MYISNLSTFLYKGKTGISFMNEVFLSEKKKEAEYLLTISQETTASTR